MRRTNPLWGVAVGVMLIVSFSLITEMGRPAEATRFFTAAYLLADDLDNRRLMSQALRRLGRSDAQAGRLDQAAQALDLALTIAQVQGERAQEAAVLTGDPGPAASPSDAAPAMTTACRCCSPPVRQAWPRSRPECGGWFARDGGRHRIPERAVARDTMPQGHRHARARSLGAGASCGRRRSR